MRSPSRFFPLLLAAFSSLAACASREGLPVGGYCSDGELAARESPCSLILPNEEWMLQYPSGSASEGMRKAEIGRSLKSKYISLYRSPEGIEYIRFSLDASDQGKSPNGSSVRVELSSRLRWKIGAKSRLEYSFYMTSTDPGAARFTVGQFLQKCGAKDSPLCRIEVEGGRLRAYVKNYDSGGLNTCDADARGLRNLTHKYDLGALSAMQETKIALSVEGRILRIYRDGSLAAEHEFPAGVDGSRDNYFKAGIYYQNRDSPKIFSEVFMRGLKVVVGE